MEVVLIWGWVELALEIETVSSILSWGPLLAALHIPMSLGGDLSQGVGSTRLVRAPPGRLSLVA